MEALCQLVPRGLMVVHCEGSVAHTMLFGLGPARVHLRTFEYGSPGDTPN